MACVAVLECFCKVACSLQMPLQALSTCSSSRFKHSEQILCTECHLPHATMHVWRGLPIGQSRLLSRIAIQFLQL